MRGQLRIYATCIVLGLAVGALAIGSPASAQGYGNAPAGAYNWSGWYLGGNAGYGWRSENPYPSSSYYQGLGVVAYGSGGAPELSKHQGFTAGGTLGYQYQFGWLVLGADYDVQYVGMADKPRNTSSTFAKQTGTSTSSGGNTFTYDSNGQIVYTTGTTSGSTPTYSSYTAGNYDPSDGDANRWLGLARLRVGVAVDRWMFYATGGAAYRFSYATMDPYVVQPNGSVITYSGYNKADAWGWVIGGGVEYGVSDWITAKVEYLHMDFGAATYIDPIATTAVGSPVLYKYDREVDIIRAGLSFRFNWGGAGSAY